MNYNSPRHSRGTISKGMNDEFKKILDQIGEVLTYAGFYDTQLMDEGKSLPEEEQQFYDVLMFCYDLLTRTTINLDDVVPMPEEMKEPWEEGEQMINRHSVGAGADADFAFALATGKGQVSFRKLLRTILVKKNVTVQQACKSTNQGQPNMSRYLNNKQSLSSDNLEKAINYALSK